MNENMSHYRDYRMYILVILGTYIRMNQLRLIKICSIGTVYQ